MAKRKTTSKKNDTQVAAIIAGLFAAVVILFLIFSKAHQEPSMETAPGEQPLSSVQAPQEEVPNEMPAAVTHHHMIAAYQQEQQEETPNPQPIGNISGSGAKIAFIIDDWGQTIANCRYLKEIPEPMAVSILPGLRHTKDVANCAREYNKVAMLHLPLEALHNGDFYPPDYIIKTNMPPSLVNKIVEEDLDQLPSIEGVNNHMGSKATADRPLMTLIFRKIKPRGLFFVDSMTSPHSISAKLAGEMGLAYGRRDVFLDNINTREAIVKQLVALARVARRHGYAVAIGHDRHLTMQVLKDEIPWLEHQGFQIVSIKELLHNR